MIDAAFEVAGDETDCPAEDRGQPDRGERHGHRHARSVEQAREQIAPELIGTEPRRGRRQREAARAHRERIGRREQRGAERAEDDSRRQHESEHRGLLPAELLEETTGLADRGGRKRLVHDRDEGAHFRTRGSSTPCRRSTTRLTTTNTVASTSVTPVTTGKSRFWIDSRSRRPRPGRMKISSVSTSPPIITPIWTPVTFSTAMSEFASTWRETTRISSTPFARAVRT